MTDEPNWEFDRRDICILKELTRDPQISSRKLSDRLERTYDIDVSHVTVSESVRKMRANGVFRDAIMIDESFFDYSLVEFKFDPTYYANNWRDAKEFIENDRHTLFFSRSRGEYQWTAIMLFPSDEVESQWVHDFYTNHGKLVDNVRIQSLHEVFRFQTDPGILEYLLE